MTRVKVLFVEYCDYTATPIGGQHSFIRALLANIDVDIYLAGITTGNEPLNKWLERRFPIGNRPFFAFNRLTPNGPPNKFPRRLRMFLSVMKAKNRILQCKPDVIYAQSPEAALPFLIGNTNTPLVFRLAGANNPLKYSRLKWARLNFFQSLYNIFFLKPIIRRASRVIAINKDCVSLCAHMRNGLRPNWVHLPVAVDRKIFHPLDQTIAREKLGINHQYPIITCVGKLTMVKGNDFALEVFCNFLKNKEARLFFIGDGEDRTRLETEAQRMGISEKVIFWGTISHEKLPLILNSSNVFFMTSHAEGVPNALLEALACGLPVVTTAVGGIPEVIKDKYNGYLLHHRDVAHASVTLNDALETPKVFTTRGLRTIDKDFSVQNCAERIEKIFVDAKERG